MKDNDENNIRDSVVIVLRHLTELHSSEDAILKILEDIYPHVSPEIQNVLEKYQAYKSEFYIERLLELEKIHPWLAAEIDKMRPLISPDEHNEP